MSFYYIYSVNMFFWLRPTTTGKIYVDRAFTLVAYLEQATGDTVIICLG